MTLVDGGRRRHRVAGKGHAEEMAAFLDAVTGHAPPALSWRSQVAVTLATFAALESLRREGEPVTVDVDALLADG